VSGSAVRTVNAQALAQLRPVEICAIAPSGRIEFRIQRELKNYNSANRNPHWSKKHKTLKIWQTALSNALVSSLGYERARDILVPESGLFGARGSRCTERRRVEITRLVPSRRHFVRDTFENLPWTAKELRDALKHTGLIHDDSAKWTETAITQDVSNDGTFWTWIAIEDAR
jgi:hypothetical protein